MSEPTTLAHPWKVGPENATHDIFAVARDHQWTIARGVTGEREQLRHAAQTEVDATARGVRVVVVPHAPTADRPAKADQYAF